MGSALIRYYYVRRLGVMFGIAMPATAIVLGALALIRGEAGWLEASAGILHVYLIGWPVGVVVALGSSFVSQVSAQRLRWPEPLMCVVTSLVLGAATTAWLFPSPLIVLVGASTSLVFGLLAPRLALLGEPSRANPQRGDTSMPRAS